MSAAAKFPWPSQNPKADPKAELRSRFESAGPAPSEDAVQNDSRKDLTKHVPEDPATGSRLLQVERLESVGRLAGGVAHDFNNLLTGVLLYCDLILALQPENRVRRYVEEIRNAGIQATGLVRQLLAVARPATCDPRLLSLNDIAEGMRNLLTRLIGENIELQFHLDAELGLVRMDPTQAQQILLNLVLNARDALPGGGWIAIETRNCQIEIVTDRGVSHPRSGATGVASLPCALFVVADNGDGMDAATQSHVFEAFFTTKPAGKGTGLGLSTVHDIVTSNGGLIHVDSAPARGTRITILLPLVPEAAQTSQPVNTPVLLEPDFSEPDLTKPEKNEGALPAIEKD